MAERVELIEKEAIEQVRAAQIEVNKLAKDVIALFNASKGKSIFSFEVDSPKKLQETTAKLAENQKKLATATEQVDVAYKEQLKAEKALITTIERKNLATESTNRELIKQRGELNRTNAELRKNDKIANALDKTYQKLNSKYARLNKLAQEAGAKFGVQSKQFKKASAEALKYRAKIDAIDKTLKNSQRNVGNYSSALKGTTQVFTQLVGALGVSGGIYAFVELGKAVFDTVKELDGLNKALLKVSETEAAYTENKAFLTDITERYGVAINATTKEYTKFLAGLKGTNLEGEKGTEIFDKVIKVSAALGRSQDETNGALNAFTQIISKGTVQAEELRGQLGDRLPGAFNIMARSIGVTVEELNDMLKKGEVIADEVLPNFAKELEKTFGLETTNRVDTLNAATTRLSNTWVLFIDEIETGNGVISKFFISFSNGLADIGSQFTNIVTASDNFAEFLGNLMASGNPAGAAGVQTLAFMKREQKQINTLSKELAELTVDNEKEQLKLNKAISREQLIHIRTLEFQKLGSEELRNRIKLLKEANKDDDPDGETNTDTDRKTESKVTAIDGNTAKGIIPQLEEQIKLLEKVIQLENDPRIIAGLENQKKAKQEQIKAIRDGDAVTLEGIEETEKSMNDMLDLIVKRQNAEEFAALKAIQAEEDRQEALQKTADILAIIGDFVNAGADLAIAITERKISALEEERDAIEENAETQLAKAEETAANEAELEEKKRIIEEEKQIKQEALDKKIAKEKTKQAKIDKVAALNIAAIQTAIGVIAALAQVPFTPANYVQAALVGALGAIQIATIAATPLPKYKEGKGKSDNYQGLALLNDGGKTEYREDKLGNIHEIKGRNVIGHVGKDDIVHKDFDTMLKYHNVEDIMSASYALTVPKAPNHKQQEDNFKEDIKSVLRDWKFHNHIDSSQIGEAVSKAMDDYNYKNNLL